LKFKLKGAEYELAENLTFGEELDIARELGNAGDNGYALGRIWISVRRVHARTTLEDLRDAEIEEVADEEDALPPTSAPASESNGASETLTVPVSIGGRG
jgi:hypothetical protein